MRENHLHYRFFIREPVPAPVYLSFPSTRRKWGADAKGKREREKKRGKKREGIKREGKKDR